MTRPTFHWVDYVVFGATIAVSLGIGLFFAFRGSKNASNNEYLMGNRKMKVIPIAMSLIVTYLSSIEIVGNPAEVYAYGAQYMLYVIAALIGIMSGTFLFIPLFYPLQITSIFEYHNMRFHRRYVEITAVLISMLVLFVANGMLIFTPCVALQAVCGFPARTSMVITGVVGVIYTTLGGIKAVVWTDVFQALVIILGLLTIVIKGTIEAGGVSEVWRINGEWGRLEFFDFRIDPTVRLTFWILLLWYPILWMCIVVEQPSVQRFMALPTMKKAKISSLILAPGLVTSGLLTCAVGMTAFAYYAKQGCDPVSGGILTSSNEILAYFIMDVMNVPGLPGIFIACLFSASLSTVSSCYNALAAMVWHNMLKYKYGHLPPKTQTNITKLSTLIAGVLSIGCAFLLIELGGTIIQIAYSIMGSIYGPLAGVSFVGGLMPKAGPRGVFVGVLLGLAFCLWLNIGASFTGNYAPALPGPTYNCSVPVDNHTIGDITTGIHNFTTAAYQMETEKKSGLEWMYSISYFYYPVFGVLIVFLVSAIFMIPGLDVPQNTPRHLIFPFVRRCCGKEQSESDLDEKFPEKELFNSSQTKDLSSKDDKDDDEFLVWIKNDKGKESVAMNIDKQTTL